MRKNYPNKLTTVLAICLVVLISQSFSVQDQDTHKPKNLKVLPEDISEEKLKAIMKTFSKSLGVRCDHCHMPMEGSKHLDFASDEKPEKLIARDMMRMTAAINKEYISKIGDGDLQQVRCVTCHMGHVKPVFEVDSLPGNSMPKGAPMEEHHHEEHEH